ncbi:MAG: hypothetical protein IJS54_00855, partial [Desulfovibrio sp.]|nr:hypothetical protein [Desulfovibrio sp.]
DTAKAYQFLHWELAFPEVFFKKSPGFDVVLGNPPWERIKIQEKEWFAGKDDAIAKAPNASVRTRMINTLKKEDPLLYKEFTTACAKAAGASHFIRNSKRYPLCGRGDINLYAVFAETMRHLVNKTGRVGCILPSGIASDDTSKFFFQELIRTKSLISFFDFENKGIFPGVHSSYKFALVTMGSGHRALAQEADFMFFAHSTEDLTDPVRRFSLSEHDIATINPNTNTCPLFRSRMDAELTKAVYRRVPVLVREATEDHREENPWGVRFFRMFDMTNDAHLFRTKEQLLEAKGIMTGNRIRVPEEATVSMGKGLVDEYTVLAGEWLPLYEAKMIHHYNHRWATYEEKGNEKGERKTRALEKFELSDPHFCGMPRYWVHEGEVEKALQQMGWEKKWVMGWRDITNSTNERTLIGAILPRSAIGNNIPISIQNAKNSWILPSIMSSYVCDFFTRFKVGGVHVNFFILQQLPILPPEIFEHPLPYINAPTLADFLKPRILELVYTTWDMQGFAKDLGFDGAPFPWDEERRFQLQAELDALFFHLYLPSLPDGSWKKADQETDKEFSTLTQFCPTPRDAMQYSMDTFPIKRKKDIAAYGTYKTKNTILQYYDAIQKSIASNKPYTSL